MICPIPVVDIDMKKVTDEIDDGVFTPSTMEMAANQVKQVLTKLQKFRKVEHETLHRPFDV